jgi:nucleoside-diphosphate-sugar epimerase
MIETIQQLTENLSNPTDGVIETIKKSTGNFIVLGAAGKMGPTLCQMLQRSIDKLSRTQKVIAVSRFSNSQTKTELEQQKIETITCNLLDRNQIESLPDAENVIFMAGQKFGSTGNESLTWAQNVYLPSLVAERYKNSRIVAFSTGNVYAFSNYQEGGSIETDIPGPVGEYAQSCLGRERIFEYFSQQYNIPVLIFRLNYAVELRYGVLLDIAQKVYSNIPIDLTMGFVNVIWQRDANAQAIQCLDHTSSPAEKLNVTGSNCLSIRLLAESFGTRFNKKPTYQGCESETALLSNSKKAQQLFGEPETEIEEIIDLIAHWITINGETLSKPTHFEVRNGKF